MIESIQSTDKYLYHYTKADTATRFILKSRTLKLGAYKNTNDPKESKNWLFNQGTNGDRDLSKHTNAELSDWLSRELKERTRLICFSLDRNPLTGSHLADICNRGFCKPRMWAQYGENHKGICLVFDREKIDDLITKQINHRHLVLRGPIIYRNRSIVPNLSSPEDQQYLINVDHLERVGKQQYVWDHITTHYKRLFFEKMNDWRDEDEWRIVVFSDTDRDLYIHIKDSLVGIMFGEYTSACHVKKVMKITADLGIRYMGVKWRNCTPWYDYENPIYRSKNN